jgi:A/G-specific adenine glycosylase
VAIEGPLLAKKTRGITRYRITESIHAVKPPEIAVQEAGADGELVWVPVAELGSVTLSGPHRRWVNELLAAERVQAGAERFAAQRD